MLSAEIKYRLEVCIQRLNEGRLEEGDLRAIIEALSASPPRRMQDLLYLQAASTSPFAAVLGISMVKDGQPVEIPRDAGQWPYRTVIEAIRDGWRILSFPNLALMMDESRIYGLGCEFILER